jgi:plasmid replication initiation protein
MLEVFMNEIVKYRNEMNKVALRNFKSKELDLFIAIVSRMREKNEQEITFTFDYLKELTKYETSHSTDLFFKELKSMYDKLIQCVWGWENEKEIVRFVLFTKYKVDKDNQTVKVKVNEEFTWVLNVLTEGLFTRFELEEFIELKSSYTKEFYRRMKQFRTTGIWKVSIEEFRRLLDVPANYRICDIDNWVLKPIQKELKKKYNLKIKKKYNNKGRGRPKVSGFEFTFEKEKVSCNLEQGSIKINNFIGRKIRLYDSNFQRFNIMTVLSVDGKEMPTIKLQNVDDEYIQEFAFNSLEHLKNWFEKNKI